MWLVTFIFINRWLLGMPNKEGPPNNKYVQKRANIYIYWEYHPKMNSLILNIVII
jgi:hypothetical protein